MLGKLGYPSFNLERPKSFYYTTVKLADGRTVKRRRSARSRSYSSREKVTTKVVHQQASDRGVRESADDALFMELKRMREMIKDKESSGSSGVDDRLRMV